jgi:hypothetical protein
LLFLLEVNPIVLGTVVDGRDEMAQIRVDADEGQSSDLTRRYASEIRG